MKTVDISEAVTDLASLLADVEAGEEVVIARDGQPIARLSKALPRFEREPGILRRAPAWRDFVYDPAIFAPLMTDEELREEGWEV